MPRPSNFSVILAALAMGLAGCAGTGPTSATASPGASITAGPTLAVVPASLRGLRVTTVALDGRALRVAVAESSDARRRGLMDVADLGPLDGLLFAYPAPVETSFHMRNVPIPLDIAFFDAEGRLVAVVAMAVCEAEPCPSYRSPAPFRWALEAPAGDLLRLAQDAMLSLEP